MLTHPHTLCIMYDSVWFKEMLWFSGVGSDYCMAFHKKGKDRMVVLDFVSAWVSVGGTPDNLEFVCVWMQAWTLVV